MSLSVSPVDDDIYKAVKAFLVAALPLDPANVIKWQQNRVAPPLGGTALSGTGYATMQIVTKKRLRTNVDLWDPIDPDPASITREQGVEVEMQMDLYGAVSGDWAVIVSTLWRDQYGCDALAPACQPLHADEPTFADLTDSESQYEPRWIVRGKLQYNPIVAPPQEYARVLAIDVISVDVEYPPE